MAYITSMEQMGIDKGIKQGIQTGIQLGEATMLQSLLESKFLQIPKHYLKRIEEAPADILLQWAKRFISAQCVEEVFDE